MSSIAIRRFVPTLRAIILGDRPTYPVAIREPRPQHQVIATPRHIPSVYEQDVKETGAFVMEGDVTAWNWQPGTQVARLDVQDYAMNAAMQGSGQTNISLNIPVGVANYIPPRARVRVTIEVL